MEAVLNTKANESEASERRATVVSAEAALQREIAELAEWLVARGLNLRCDLPHAGDGSRDRLYWRYGYFIGLKQALAMLTTRGATVH